jgi:hypothetical protein
MRQMTEPTRDCRPPEEDHSRFAAVLEGLAMASALWHPTGALTLAMMRRQREADCEDTKGGAS